MRILVRRGFVLVTALGIGATLVGATAPALANKCANTKLKAAGTAADALLACHAEAVAKGEPLDSACVQKATSRLQTAFADADDTDTCRVPGEVSGVQSEIEAAVSAISTALGGPGPSRCTKKRLRASGKKARMLHNCVAKAAGKAGPGLSVDHKCLDRPDEQFTKAFLAAESKGDCIPSSSDADEIAAEIEALLVGTRSALAPPLLTCEPVMVTATHGEGQFVGNTGLAKIENGKVPCAHTDTEKIASCLFSTTSGSESGAWVESPQGNFAIPGQAVSLQGVPGGDYVIGSRVSDTSGRPCIDPAGMDSVGAPAAIPLSAGCQVEVLRSARNASGFFLENHATLEVCTSSFPHPDSRVEGLENVPVETSDCADGPVVVGPCCYTGKGAALNDRGGRERDVDGTYLPENRHCHFGALGDLTFPVAKRPNTKFSGGVAVIDDTTPIVWRMVKPGLDIAND